MQDIDEIKTIIVLSGNKRLPDLEEEIFANTMLTDIYMRNLSAGRWWSIEGDNTRQSAFAVSAANGAIFYAQTVIRGRWLAAEHLIASEPWIAVSYAQNIVGGRWIEAEETIKKDKRWWKEYTESFNITDE